MLRVLTILIGLTLISCGARYEIDEQTLKWQPYQVGDILIFKSSTNQIDSVFVQNIDTYTNPDDPLDFFSDYHETMFVTGEMTLRTPFTSTIGVLVTKEHVNLIEIHSDKKNDRFLLTIYRPRDTINFPTTILQIPESDSIESTSTRGNNFSIEAKEHYNLTNSDDLKAYFWNKNLGYLGYELENGEVCTLTQFWRDGKNLLQE